jgi:hypothetical protein
MPHGDMNQLIRGAAGYPAPEPRPESERIGQIGIGRGGAAIPSKPAPPSMSSVIRAQVEMQRRERDELAYYYDNLAGETP